MWADFWFAAAIVAPSIILHEFGHKFTAMAFGMGATFNAPLSIRHILNPSLIFHDFLALLMLFIIISRIFHWGKFIFFVPAYTTITSGAIVLQSAAAIALQSAAISFAGPAVNLIIWLVSLLVLKKAKKLKPDKYHFFFLLSRINMFLFIFNMLPIPMFDGYGVFSNLVKVIF